MTEADILNLISTGENDTCEFKSSFNAETIETLVAFANSKGGYVLVGVSNSGKTVGVNIQKETLQLWLNEVKSKTSPMLIPDVKALTVNDKTIVLFSVKEYPVKPVAVKGRFYRRITNSNSLMTASEVSELYMQTMQYSWDSYPYPNASPDDLDNAKIERFVTKVKDNRRLRISGTPMDILHKLSLIKDDKPTNASMLLFAKQPLMFDIQAGRLKTNDYILDNFIIRDTLFEAVEKTMKYIISHLKVAYEISTETVKKSTRRKEIFEYPLEAL
jgi:ATP-dependent DNA helicase RecG